ncbi:hypothetical protein D0B54_22185 [Solimonas sp. K1W22B-7]|nr:hypothetical protein D0B54_22185 [Solimonas sp. K1W22B-7]
MMLGLCGPAAAACAPDGGFRWLGCEAATPELRSHWAGGGATAGLESAFRLAEWSNDEYSRQRLRLRFDARSDTEDLLRRWRYGAGLDLQLPGDGLFQASISTSKRRRGEGARYALTPDGLSSGRNGEALWTLGLSLAPEDRSDGRRLMLTPQMRLDIDRWLETRGSAELYVEYTPWIHDLKGSSREDRENMEDRLDERMPQLQMRWRF